MNATRVIELATKTQERRRIVQVRKMEQNALQQGFHSEYTLVNHLNHFFKYYWHGIQTKIYSQWTSNRSIEPRFEESGY